MSNDEKQKLSVAYHEAGHAVVAAERGGVVTAVEITKGKEWKGMTAVTDLDADADRAAYFAAGAIAQEKGQPGSAGLFTDARDVIELDKLANKQIAGSPLIGAFALPEDKRKRERFLTQSRQTAAGIIDRRWAEIDAIAKALFRKDRLTGEDVDQLMTPSDKE